MNREQAIAAIKAGTHVLDINGYQGTKDAIEFLSKLEWYPWGASNRYYGKDKYGVINLLFKYEIKGCPIIKLSDILSESETAISENKGQEKYSTFENEDMIVHIDWSTFDGENVRAEIEYKSAKDMREYDEKLLQDYEEFLLKQPIGNSCFGVVSISKFLDNRYPNKELEELLRQREELDKRINELNNVNKNKKKY